MKAVKWRPESLIARNDGLQMAIADILGAAERGERLRVRIERSKSCRILGRQDRVAAFKAQFREGCIKVVESGIWSLPQKARVLAEIHRRLDQVPESDRGSAAWRSSLASVYDFAGAWALAARLMHAGLKVSVLEEDPTRKASGRVDVSGVDVSIVIPICVAKDV